VDDFDGTRTCTSDLADNTKECATGVYDSRMYIIASMHMGNAGFEGSIDTDAFNLTEGPEFGGPEFEIDYIKVFQPSEDDTDTYTWCGLGGNPCSVR